VAGGVAVGFAVSRLLKASSRRRYEESRQSWAGNGHGQRSRVGAPREGVTESGITGGTPATSPGATTPITPPVADTPPGRTPPAPTTGWREPDVPR
jgi:hypothetical protein